MLEGRGGVRAWQIAGRGVCPATADLAPTHTPSFIAALHHAIVIEIIPHNVVCGGSVGVGVPLDIVAGFAGAEYDPGAFPGAKFRLNECTVQIFATGKVTVVGALTKEAAYRAMDMMVGLLADHGVPVGKTTKKVYNVVSTAAFGRDLDLAMVVRAVTHSLYEPDGFPGVIMWRQNPKCTILLFASGKLVCTGAKSVEETSSAVNQLYRELEERNLL